ncbi:MAG: ABC transporter permease [Candidatus Sericytochromatia bacterium]|nr:MAG: ABC transporter permease [Candidatus Sericytochromatia bacterium]
MNVELFIALKQLKGKYKQVILAIISVCIGVAILICALSLTNGFEKDLVNKIIGTNPHVFIESALSDRIENYQYLIDNLKTIDNNIKYVNPVIKGQALINNGIEVRGVLVYSINPKMEKDNWEKYIIKGSLKNSNSIVLGKELSRKMSLDIGDKINLITGVGISNEFIVTGIFQADFYELDSRIVYINIESGQKIFNLDKSVNGISIKLIDPFLANKISEEILKKYPFLSVRSWLRDNRAILSAMTLEKKVIFLVIMFIIIVAMLGISNLLVMMVIEKVNEISILRAIGASNKNIILIFMYQGIIIGIVGIVLGCILGFIISKIISLYPIKLPSDVYIISNLPVDIQLNDFIMVSISALFVSIISSLIPIRKIIKLNPLEAIRRNN